MNTKRTLDGQPRDLHARLAEVLAQAPAFMCLLRGPDHVFEFANEQYLDLLGRRDVVGQSVRKVFDEADVQPFFDVLDAVYRTGKPYVGREVPILLRAGGSQFPTRRHFLNFVYQPLRDERGAGKGDGAVSGIFVHGVDVTELVEGREALRQNEERLRLGLDAGGIGLWDWDIRTGKVQWSDRVYTLHGLTPETFGGTVDAFIQRVHPEDRDRVSQAIQEAIRTRSSYEVEFRIVRPGGDVRWISTTGTVMYDAAGAATRMLGATRDVTDRKRAEISVGELAGRVKQQARLIEQIASTTPDFIYTFDRNGKFLYANKRLLEVWGVTFEQAVGKGLPELGYPDWHVEMHHREIRQVIETKRPIKGQVPFTGGSGISGIYEYIFTPVFDANGEVEVIAGTTRDVTDRQRVEQQLAEARAAAEVGLARWQAIVDNMAEGVVLADGEGRVLELNRAALEMYGLGSIEEARRNPGEISTEVELRSASDDAVVRPDQFPIRRVMRGEHFTAWEGRVRRWGDSRSRQISFSGTPIRDRDGQIVFVLLTLHDVTAQRETQTALRESERRLRAVVEATPESVTIIRPDGELLYVNPAGLTMIEAPSLDAVRGSSIYDTIAPEHRERYVQHHERVCAGEKLNWEFEIIGFNGARRWMETHAVPLQTADGRVGQLAVTREITARKAAEAEREQLLRNERASRMQAEQINRMKDEFLATLSHELRTPMSAILGWSQILRRDAKPATLSQGLATIERNARVQTQIIEDLLDMSRIISGKVRLNVQRIELAPVVEAAIETVRHAAQAKGVGLHVSLGEVNGIVLGDPNRLQQVFWNLLTNAVKFTPRDGQVHVMLALVDGHVEVSITDTGEGIRAEFLPFVFDRFRQADPSTTRRHGGLGLGLSIVKQLVELHGGAVRVKSDGEGRGSSFVVALPLSITAPGAMQEELDAAPRPADEPLHPTPEPTAADLSGVRVVLVDDEPDARALIERLLSDCGAVVMTAAAAAEAIDLVRREQPDLLISDIGMPEEDGYSLIRRVRRLTAREGGGVASIALTAYARSEDRVRALTAGFQSHVVKPVDPAELIAVVASLTRRIQG